MQFLVEYQNSKAVQVQKENNSNQKGLQKYKIFLNTLNELTKIGNWKKNQPGQIILIREKI